MQDQQITDKKQKLSNKIISNLLIPRFTMVVALDRRYNEQQSLATPVLNDTELLLRFVTSVEEILGRVGIQLNGERIGVKTQCQISEIISVNKSLTEIYNIVKVKAVQDIAMFNKSDQWPFFEVNHDRFKTLIENTEAFKSLISDILQQKQKGFTKKLIDENMVIWLHDVQGPSSLF